MTSAGGFWSYNHDDDSAEQGRIRALARDLAAQYELMTGEPIALFLDNASIAWGEDWREKIEQNLGSIAFFVPVITPRYFRSSACRSELQTFARGAAELGVRELILPLVYVDVPELHEENPADDAVALVKTFQWVDWRELRLTDRESGAYRTAVADMARRLVEANQRLVFSPPPLPPSRSTPTGPDDVDDADGSLDVMAATEVALPAWNDNVQSITEEIRAVSAVVNEAGERIKVGDAQGKGFAARLATARDVAAKLSPHADRIEELGNQFTTYLYDVDRGFKAMIARAEVEVAETPESKDQFCTFFRAVKEMVQGYEDGTRGLQSMVDAMTPVESVSREMRVPLRKLRQGLSVMIEGGAVTQEWKRLVDASSIEC